MKIQPECVPCLLKRIIFESELRNKDELLKTQIINKTCSLLAKLYNPSICSAEIATHIHKLAYDLLQDRDPYHELKKQSNQVALNLLPTVKEIIQQSDDSVEAAMKISIIGNVLDFGIEGGSTDPARLTQDFQRLYNEELGYDDYQHAKDILAHSEKIILFTDNCGEIIFDKLLCEELKKAYPTIQLTVVVRGEPIISDATLHDAQEISLTQVVDQILTTGCFAIGVDFKQLPNEVKQCISTADLIICKGMANYEAFSETTYHPILYLLRAKCTAIARSMQIPLNRSAIKLYTKNE